MSSPGMLALSIRQPWAWLIVHGPKRIENRAWPTRYRGPFLIHASKWWSRRIVSETLDALRLQGLLAEPAKTLGGGPFFPIEQMAVETGGIVGRAVLVDCVTEHRSSWFAGPFGFVLADDVEPLPFRPWRGELGLFRVPDAASVGT